METWKLECGPLDAERASEIRNRHFTDKRPPLHPAAQPAGGPWPDYTAFTSLNPPHGHSLSSTDLVLECSNLSPTICYFFFCLNFLFLINFSESRVDLSWQLTNMLESSFFEVEITILWWFLQVLMLESCRDFFPRSGSCEFGLEHVWISIHICCSDVFSFHLPNSMDLLFKFVPLGIVQILLWILELEDFKIWCARTICSKVFVGKETVTDGGLCKDTCSQAGVYLQIAWYRSVYILPTRFTSNGPNSSFQVSTGHGFPWDTFSVSSVYRRWGIVSGQYSWGVRPTAPT
jgi:hypothetical protein